MRVDVRRDDDVDARSLVRLEGTVILVPVALALTTLDVEPADAEANEANPEAAKDLDVLVNAVRVERPWVAKEAGHRHPVGHIACRCGRLHHAGDRRQPST